MTIGLQIFFVTKYISHAAATCYLRVRFHCGGRRQNLAGKPRSRSRRWKTRSCRGRRFSLDCQLRIITSMQKLFLNVAASLLFVAPVILAQAPADAAQGPAGPDA